MKMIDLAGNWKLRAEFLDVKAEQFQKVLNREPGTFTVFHEGRTNAFPSKTGFMDASVPGDVITALVKYGIINEPLEKTNTKHCLWIRDLSWWFIRPFEIDENLLKEDSVRLYIEMLDFKADIIVNGQPVGGQKNAFCAYDEDIKRFLTVGRNTIIIRLSSGIEDNYPKDSISYYCASPHAIADQRIYLRKPQFTYGWDWCQPVPTCGIGREICINCFSAAKINHVRVDTLSIQNGSVDLNFHFEVEKTAITASEKVHIRYELLDQDKVVFEKEISTILNGGLNFIDCAENISDLKLWWPNGYGEPYFYTLRCSCLCRRILNQSEDKDIGIRTVEIDQSDLEDGSKNFYFVINGVRVFCKGGNWVPTDSVYLRTPEASYRKLVDEAKEANFTMLRMWGGGTYEPDFFYDYCSKNGIMIMHDFMYACAFYPDLDHSFLFEAMREAEFQTKRLAHYPCLVMWTGNNEIHESYTDWFPEPYSPERFHGEKIFNYLLPETVRRNSPTTLFMPSSPYMGNPRSNQVDEGDVHAWTYLGRDPKTKFKFQYELEAFDRLPARFSSEYGFYGALVESSVERFHAGEEVVRDGEIWQHHGEPERKSSLINEAIDRHLIAADSLDTASYLLYSGIMQGLLYSEMAEGIRQKAYGSGNLIWMYNDCWPETGWTVIDYYLSRKVSFYHLKRAFAPRKLILRQKEGSNSKAILTIINDSPQEFQAQVDFGYMQFSGKTGCTGVFKTYVSAHSWHQTVLDISGNLNEGLYYAEDQVNGFERVDSLRAYYRDYHFPVPQTKITEVSRDGKDTWVTIVSDTYVPIAYLTTSDDRAHFSDNYFKLYPQHEKTVRISNCVETPTLNVAITQPNS